MNKNNIITTVRATILLAILIVGVRSISAFSNPPGAPTACPTGYPGCDAPLNVGPGTQSKAGSLTLNASSTQNPTGLYVFGQTVLDNSTLGGSAVKIIDGQQHSGYVLTSDGNGNAVWAAPTGGSSMGGGISPTILSTNGTYHVTIPAGTYYFTAFGAGGGAGGAESGGGSSDGGGGSGGAYVFAQCVFNNAVNTLNITVGRGGDGGINGTAGFYGGTTTVSYGGSVIMISQGGAGGKDANGNFTSNTGGSFVSVASPCSQVASASGGAGYPNAGTSAAGGGGAGNGGAAGPSMIGHVGNAGGTVTDSTGMIAKYSVVGGNGGAGNCDGSVTNLGNESIFRWFGGTPGTSPGGGGGGSCNGVAGGWGADGLVMISPVVAASSSNATALSGSLCGLANHAAFATQYCQGLDPQAGICPSGYSAFATQSFFTCVKN